MPNPFHFKPQVDWGRGINSFIVKNKLYNSKKIYTYTCNRIWMAQKSFLQDCKGIFWLYVTMISIVNAYQAEQCTLMISHPQYNHLLLAHVTLLTVLLIAYQLAHPKTTYC
jgi:hypothetical protein